MRGSMSELKERCLNYIAQIAELKGVRYSIHETMQNRHLLVMLWDECNVNGADPERLKEICKALLEASIVGVVQGAFYFPEPSPEEMEEYQTLFRHPFEFLAMRDKPVAPIRGRPVTFEISVESDSEEAMRLTPNVQLSLFDMEGV
jgi:hypothetical protein